MSAPCIFKVKQITLSGGGPYNSCSAFDLHQQLRKTRDTVLYYENQTRNLQNPIDLKLRFGTGTHFCKAKGAERMLVMSAFVKVAGFVLSDANEYYKVTELI